VNRKQLFWLFFGFSGRLSRAPYFLAAMLLAIFQAFPLYQLSIAPAESEAGQFWATAFSATLFISIWPYVALGVKRLHDFGKPGILAVTLFIPVVAILAFIALCLYPGHAGPNEYGDQTNEPR
jgi:uncharacterized membrane protein YhaH (DUF805 family)